MEGGGGILSASGELGWEGGKGKGQRSKRSCVTASLKPRVSTLSTGLRGCSCTYEWVVSGATKRQQFQNIDNEGRRGRGEKGEGWSR